jgi:hypothetical protein
LFGHVVLLIAIISLFIGGPIEHMLLGWLYFPVRTLPQVSFDWPTAILSAVCAIAFIAGLHHTILWFLNSSTIESTQRTTWTWRSTLVASITLMLMFAAGTAMVGATHQFVWLCTGRTEKGEQSPRQYGILTFAIASARGAAQQSQQRNNMKQLALAFDGVHSTFKSLPPGGTMTETGELLHGWPIFLGNFTSYTSMGIDYSIPWNQPPNDRMYRCGLPDYINPCQPGPRFDEQGYGLSHVAGNIHVLPIRQVGDKNQRHDSWYPFNETSKQTVTKESISDGTSNTLLIGTAAGRFKPWGHPANIRDPALGINRDAGGFGGPPQWNGAMFVMCDGSVRRLSNNIDPKVLKALGTPSGNENLPDEW